jgi:Flp pilus assembly protein TadD
MYAVMYDLDISNNLFTKCLSLAAQSLRHHEQEKAYYEIIEAMRIFPDSPQPHNLLGIWFEINGDDIMARRHYRAAYSLDPTFKPACKNIERICTFENPEPFAYDFGDEPEEQKNLILENDTKSP